MAHHLTPISSNILHTLFFQNWYAWTWQAIDYSIGSKKVGNESFSPKSAQRQFLNRESMKISSKYGK